MRNLFCKSKNGHLIFYDSETSHASTHFAEHAGLEGMTKKSLEDTEIDDDKLRFEYDTGEEIGMMDLVETVAGDEIVFAKRPLRQVYNRFVKNKMATPTNYVTIEVRKANDGSYDLYTSYIGRLTPPTPGSPTETPESRPFWNAHALVWGNQAVEEGSETTQYPW